MIVPYFDIPESIEVDYCGKIVVTTLVISLPRVVPYSLDKVVPYKYIVTMLEDGNEVEIKPLRSVLNIADINGVTRSGRVFTQTP